AKPPCPINNAASHKAPAPLCMRAGEADKDSHANSRKRDIRRDNQQKPDVNMCVGQMPSGSSHSSRQTFNPHFSKSLRRFRQSAYSHGIFHSVSTLLPTTRSTATMATWIHHIPSCWSSMTTRLCDNCSLT